MRRGVLAAYLAPDALWFHAGAPGGAAAACRQHFLSAPSQPPPKHKRRRLTRRLPRPPADPAQAVALCKREGLPQLILEQVGAGVMEWREDTDRHLHISATLTSGDSISQGPGGAAGGSLSPTKRGGGPLG